MYLSTTLPTCYKVIPQGVECIKYNSFSQYIDTNEVPTVATIDNYMAKLHQIILDAPQENEQLILAVTEVVNKLNLEAYVT
mgnify:CR=1 FL=1